MRKEGAVIIGGGLLVLVIGTNYYHIFNAFATFLLVGGIDGTSFSLPDGFMFGGTVLALLAFIAWPFRETLRQKFSAAKKLVNHSHSKQPEL